MSASYLVAGVRTPIGRFHGGLAPLKAVELGAVVIAGALERAGVAPDQIDYTIMGHVLQAGQGQITARQAAVAAGIPIEVPALTVNKVCLSGLAAIATADQMIRAGDEGIRADTTLERLAALRPAFTEDGTVTAGNASQISDGACAVVVAGEDAVRRLGLTPLARIEAYGMSADRFSSLHTVPALAL